MDPSPCKCFPMVTPCETFTMRRDVIINNPSNHRFIRYLEPWHSDVFEFLDLRKNTGHEELRARDLFLGLWIPDLFMERVEQDGDWHLFCPGECPGLDAVYGQAFVDLYNKYVAAGKYRRIVKAQKLWFAIVDAQIETGMPYMLYKGE